MRRVARFLVLGAFGLSMAACQSARVLDREATDAFRAGRYEDAAARLRVGLDESGERDRLLYLLDLGLALHQAGALEESVKVLLRADEVSEIKDYTSLGNEAATLLLSDNIKDYRAEEYEYVYISAYLALNFALLGNLEGALVEARRINTKLYRMISEGKRAYSLSAFGRYLSGILYEASGEWDNAYISYKQTLELKPDFPELGRDLWRMTDASRHVQDREKWEAHYALSDQTKIQERARTKKGGRSEIIVVYQNGIAPEKRPNPQFQSLPVFVPRRNPITTAEIRVKKEDQALPDVVGAPVLQVAPAQLDHIEALAIKNLDEKYGKLVAKKIAGILAKEAAGEVIEKKTGNRGFGQIAKLVLYMADQADLRSWDLLPRDLQLVRIPIEPGTYTVECRPLGGGTPTSKVVQVRKDRKVFVSFRGMP